MYLEYMHFINYNLDPKAHFLSTLKIIGYIWNSANRVYPLCFTNLKNFRAPIISLKCLQKYTFNIVYFFQFMSLYLQNILLIPYTHYNQLYFFKTVKYSTTMSYFGCSSNTPLVSEDVSITSINLFISTVDIT